MKRSIGSGLGRARPRKRTVIGCSASSGGETGAGVDLGLVTPLDPSPKAGRRRRQSYSELERTTALMTASLVGVATASENLGIPRRTIYTWFEEAGGFGPMRDAARNALGATMYATGMMACVELNKRIPGMDVKQLLDTLKVVTAGAAKSHVAEDDRNAAAQENVIQVVIQETGEVIELDRTSKDCPAVAP